MLRVKNAGNNKKSFEICLRKFKRGSEEITKEVMERQFFEKPCVERERIRRRRKKEQRKVKAFKRKYGYKYTKYLEML